MTVVVLLAGCAHPHGQGRTAPPPPPARAEVNAVDFAGDVQPILQARCQPCHFAGGTMYEQLPFDRPQTIRELGAQLFTRIKDESSQATIRAFLGQGE